MLNLIPQPPPIIRLQFRILDALLTPILMHTTDMILRALEVVEFVADAFFDEDATGVLVCYRLFVLFCGISPARQRQKLKREKTKKRE